jgi:hypothetical protein
MYFRGVLGMKNKLLFLALVLSSCFAQESFATTDNDRADPPINLNTVRDGKKILYCNIYNKPNICFVFNKIKNNVVGLFFIPLDYYYYTCFYGQISKKYPNILVGTGYELAEYDESFYRNSFKPIVQSDRLNFNYNNFVIDKTRKKAKFLGATINFDALDEGLSETSSNSAFYKKYYLNTQTPDPSICSKTKF